MLSKRAKDIGDQPADLGTYREHLIGCALKGAVGSGLEFEAAALDAIGYADAVLEALAREAETEEAPDAD